MTVITACELNDLAPLRITTRETQCSHRCFGARGGQSYFSDRRHRRNNQLGKFYFFRRGRTKTRSSSQTLFERFYDLRMCVAGDQRPPRSHVIDILFSICIDHTTAAATLYEQRAAPDRAPCTDGAIHASRNVLLGFEKKLVGRGHRNALYT